jgi:hypothetical protein
LGLYLPGPGLKSRLRFLTRYSVPKLKQGLDLNILF